MEEGGDGKSVRYGEEWFHSSLFSYFLKNRMSMSKIE